MTQTEHLLSCLSEECAEVAQRVSKALRFGLDEVQSGQDLNNRERIVNEIVDLVAVIHMLEERNIIKLPPGLFYEMRAKKEKVLSYLVYAELGCKTIVGD